MKNFTTGQKGKFNPSQHGQQPQQPRSQLVVDVNERVGRITDANLHNNLKWLRNERNKFEQQVAVKHDFLITQAHRHVDPEQQALVQQHCNYLGQLDVELRNMYTQLEQINHAVHNLQLQITGKKE